MKKLARLNGFKTLSRVHQKTIVGGDCTLHPNCPPGYEPEVYMGSCRCVYVG